MHTYSPADCDDDDTSGSEDNYYVVIEMLLLFDACPTFNACSLLYFFF